MSAPDPALEALWKRVLDGWDDERVHSAFLDYCQTADRLVDAAVRYRGMSADRDRSAVAAKKLRAVAVLAMARLPASRGAETGASRRLGSVALISVFLSAILGLLAYLALTH